MNANLLNATLTAGALLSFGACSQLKKFVEPSPAEKACDLKGSMARIEAQEAKLLEVAGLKVKSSETPDGDKTRVVVELSSDESGAFLGTPVERLATASELVKSYEHVQSKCGQFASPSQMKTAELKLKLFTNKGESGEALSVVQSLLLSYMGSMEFRDAERAAKDIGVEFMTETEDEAVPFSMLSQLFAAISDPVSAEELSQVLEAYVRVLSVVADHPHAQGLAEAKSFAQRRNVLQKLEKRFQDNSVIEHRYRLGFTVAQMSVETMKVNIQDVEAVLWQDYGMRWLKKDSGSEYAFDSEAHRTFSSKKGSLTSAEALRRKKVLNQAINVTEALVDNVTFDDLLGADQEKDLNEKRSAWRGTLERLP